MVRYYPSKMTRWGVMTAKGSILCTNGEYYRPMFVGPGANSAKVYKTEEGAKRRAAQIHGSIFSIEPAYKTLALRPRSK